MKAEDKAEVRGSKDSDIARVAFKPPPFWDTNPRLWFLQLESQFRLAGITTDETKFHSVISAIDVKTLSGVADIVETPPADNLYDTLRERVLDLYSRSDSARLRLLFQDIQLGDRKPSQLLQEMRNLAEGDINEDVLKSLWLQRLPLNAQQILSISSDTLSNLTKIADKIMEISPLTATVTTISHSGELDSIKAELAEIKRTLKSLQERSSRRGNFRSNSGSRNRFRYNSKLRRNANKLCWYHQTFAGKAKKCVKPCSFQGND